MYLSTSPGEHCGRPARIGDLLVAGGFVLPSEIAAAAREQKASHAPLGNILVSHGELECQELEAVLRVQHTLDRHPEQDFRLDAEARSEAHVRLGDLLVEHGDIDSAELQAALKEQKAVRRPLGELLVERGSLSQGQLDRAVGMQRRLLGAVFSVGIAISGMGEAHAAADSSVGQDAPTSISVAADTDEAPTLDELLPEPDISTLQDTGGKIVNAASVSLRGFVQDVSDLFENVDFRGMESHFGAMDANTARDRDAFDVTDHTYVGLTFKVNFSSGGGKKGDTDLNLNFLPDDY